MLQTRDRAGIDGRKLVFDQVRRIPGDRLVVRIDSDAEIGLLFKADLTADEVPELDVQLAELLDPVGVHACWDCLTRQPQHQCTG